MNSDSGYQAGVIIAFMATYMCLAIILGGIDTLSDYGDPVAGGTDRIINTESDLVLVASPLLIFGAIILILHARDRSEE